MNVGELIAKLQTKDPNDIVLIWDLSRDLYRKIGHVKTVGGVALSDTVFHGRTPSGDDIQKEFYAVSNDTDQKGICLY